MRKPHNLVFSWTASVILMLLWFALRPWDSVLSAADLLLVVILALQLYINIAASQGGKRRYR